MNRIRNTRNTENSLRKVGGKIVKRGEGSIFDCTHLRGPRQHTLTGIKTSARSILNFLDLRTLFPDDGTHARIRDHELDSYCAAPRDRWNIKRLIIYTSDNESKSLFKETEGTRLRMSEVGERIRRTFETASRGPLTFRIRSGLPGILSETITRAPLFSRISLTWAPPLPMMIDASWVTMRHRI